MKPDGVLLLQSVAERVIARYLEVSGKTDVGIVSAYASLGGRGIDVTYAWEGAHRGIKVQADPYFGIDPIKVRDRSLLYYREDAGSFAFEAVANSATREPGWIFESEAHDLYYYYIALSQHEDEVGALLGEPDEVFFSELKVDRDDLFMLPMKPTREWFERRFQDYAPRPVSRGGISAWYRLVPRADIEGEVDGMRNIGSIFPMVAG